MADKTPAWLTKYIEGMGPLEEGNIQHRGRREIHNADGSTSTVRSMSFNDGPGREVLIPTAYDGALHSEDDAVDNYRKTGQHMGIFATPESATREAIKVHDDYEKGLYKAPVPGWLRDYMDDGVGSGQSTGGRKGKERENKKVSDFAKKVVEASRPKVNEPVSRPDRSTEWIRPEAYPETSDVTQRRQWEEKNSPASQKVQDFLNTPFHTTKDYVYPAGKEGWDTTASDAIADRYSIPRGPKRQGVTVRDTPPTDLGELDEPVRDMGEIDDPAPKTGTELNSLVTQAINNASARRPPQGR